MVGREKEEEVILNFPLWRGIKGEENNSP